MCVSVSSDHCLFLFVSLFLLFYPSLSFIFACFLGVKGGMEMGGEVGKRWGRRKHDQNILGFFFQFKKKKKEIAPFVLSEGMPFWATNFSLKETLHLLLSFPSIFRHILVGTQGQHILSQVRDTMNKQGRIKLISVPLIFPRNPEYFNPPNRKQTPKALMLGLIDQLLFC